MKQVVLFTTFSALMFLGSFNATAQRKGVSKPGKDSLTGKQISFVDVSNDKGVFTITYNDSTKETISEQEAAKRGLINHGGFGNFKTTTAPAYQNLQLRKPAVQPLYILHGKEISEEEFKNIDPNTIEAINILKDRQAIDRYGMKAKNGVIEITLKPVVVSRDSLKTHLKKFAGGKENDRLQSATLLFQGDDENLIKANITGEQLSGEAEKLLRRLQPGNTLTIEKIIVIRNGITTNLPPARITLSN